MVKPRLANTIPYVLTELDELEREEFYRLKKIREKKKTTMKRSDTVIQDGLLIEENTMLSSMQEDDVIF